jgi:hypothetical protein
MDEPGDSPCENREDDQDAREILHKAQAVGEPPPSPPPSGEPEGRRRGHLDRGSTTTITRLLRALGAAEWSSIVAYPDGSSPPPSIAIAFHAFRLD